MYDLKWLKEKGFFEHEIDEIHNGKKIIIDTVNFIAFVDHDNIANQFNRQINEILRIIKGTFPRIRMVYFYHKDRIKIYNKYSEIKWFYYTPIISRKSTKTGKENKLNQFSPQNINVLFDTKEVVSKFYKEISKFREDMAKSVKGLENENNRYLVVENYFHRLIFFYFMAQLGFIEISKDERNKITLNKDTTKKQFFENTICKNLSDDDVHKFLNTVFFDVFGTPALEQAKNWHNVSIKVGKLNFNIHAPYLNGGLFEEKEYEGKKEREITIKHSKKLIIELFNKYDWIVGEEIPNEDEELHTVGELTPDVLGYVFEQYINQKQMGAYYTKDDITGYISRNTIIPFVYDKLKENPVFTKAKEDKYFFSYIWEKPSDYIYPAVKKGVEHKLPDFIEKGINDVSKRERWNETAHEKYALPTEIWREVVDRRKRYEEITNRAKSKEINTINDFITYNLDIEGFIKHTLNRCDDIKIIKCVYNIVKEITILDPTVGSGAFLFAGLNILYPIYEICLTKLINAKDSKVLDDIKNHENNLKYFITKTIILNNLFGVDIMEDAIEICKLRLFLQLISDVENKDKIEPLPDIDFNIRCGNSLVGFTELAEVEKVAKTDIVAGSMKEVLSQIDDEAEKLRDIFHHFKDQQLTDDIGKPSIRISKKEIISARDRLNAKLNNYLAVYYGIKKDNKTEYDHWLKTHQPFHWFSEFYEILNKKGGFDVIIGNPPYVEYSKVRRSDDKGKIKNINGYDVIGYETISCGNLYAYVIEKSISLIKLNSCIGIIIPISSISNVKFKTLRDIFINKLIIWSTSFSNRPAKLFENVEQRLSIVIGKRINPKNHFINSSKYNHWYSYTREYLFYNIFYFNTKIEENEYSFPKLHNSLEYSIINKIKNQRQNFEIFKREFSTISTYYHDSPTYWIRSMPFKPNNDSCLKSSSHYHLISFDNSLLNIPFSIINSSLFYFYFKIYSNCRDLSENDILSFKIGSISKDLIKKLNTISDKLEEFYKNNKSIKSRKYPSGLVYYEEYYPQNSKHIIDEIDKVLAEHYGFTDEELDFIINYDIKYRMGDELNDDE